MEEQIANAVWSVVRLGVLAVIVVLVFGVAYLGWRGRILSQRHYSSLSSSKVDEETADYLERMTQILGFHQRRSYKLGGVSFEEDVFRQLVKDVERTRPPEGSKLGAQHRAYRDAVVTFAKARKETASQLRGGAAHVSRISGQEVVDCATAIRAQQQMRLYRQSDDKHLEVLIYCCKEEREAYERMQRRATEWRTASYFLKYGG